MQGTTNDRRWQRACNPSVSPQGRNRWRYATKYCILVLFVMLSSTMRVASAEGKEVLVVTVTTGFRHSSIPVAEEVLEAMAARNQLSIDFARTQAEMQQKMTRVALHGRGRVFYTALGHREDVWLAPWFQQHLEGALLWAGGSHRRRPARR